MKHNKGILIASIISFAVVVVGIVGGLIYIQQQSNIQKDKEFQQQKQLKEYEQEQLNARNKADNRQKCLAAANATPSVWDGLSCNN